MYYNDYGNHRNNTEGEALLERFSSRCPELRYSDIFRDIFFCTSALISVLFFAVFDGFVLLYFSTFQIIARFIEKDIWDINQFRGVLRPHV